MVRRVSGRSCGPWFLITVLAVSGCTTIPVGVKRADPRTVQRHLTASALSGPVPSMPSTVALNRLNLADSFDDDPEKALADLRSLALATKENKLYYALAELSFLHAEKTKNARGIWPRRSTRGAISSAASRPTRSTRACASPPISTIVR